MNIIKIIGVGLITLIITIILREYRKDYTIFAVLIGGAIIIYMSLDTLIRDNRFYKRINWQKQYSFYFSIIKNNRNININRICSKYLQR